MPHPVPPPAAPIRARPTAPGEAGLDAVLAFARVSLPDPVQEIRCVERYDPLCSDEGRYEIRTSRGIVTVIRSRQGEITLLDGEGM